MSGLKCRTQFRNEKSECEEVCRRLFDLAGRVWKGEQLGQFSFFGWNQIGSVLGETTFLHLWLGSRSHGKDCFSDCLWIKGELLCTRHPSSDQSVPDFWPLLIWDLPHKSVGLSGARMLTVERQSWPAFRQQAKVISTPAWHQNKLGYK